MALEDYKAVFGDQFDNIVDAIMKGGLTPQVEAMIVGTIDEMVFNVNIFSENINKTVTNMTKAGISKDVIRNTLQQDMKGGGKIFGQLRNETRETLVGGINKSGALAQYETYLNNGITEDSLFTWVTASGHRICGDCLALSGGEKTFKEWESSGLPGAGHTVCGGYCYCVVDPVGKMDKEVKVNTEAVKEKGISVKKAAGVYSQDKAMKIINSRTRHPDNKKGTSLKYYTDRAGLGDNTVNLKGMTSDTLTQMAKGLDDVLGRYDLKVDYIGYHIRGLSRKHAAGCAWQWGGRKVHALSFQKTYTKTWKKLHKDSSARYIKRKETMVRNAEYFIKYYDDMINDPKQKHYSIMRAKRAKAKYETQLRIYSNKNLNKYTVGEDFYATVVHESWHQVDYQLSKSMGLRDVNLRTIFQQKLDDLGVITDEWYEVSEYAAENIAELWAETGTALVTNNYVPTNIRTAFLETLKEVGASYP